MQKDRTGSSQQAVAKFIEHKCKKVLPPNFKKVPSVQLKKFVKSERLMKVEGSFKFSWTEKVKLGVKQTRKNNVNNHETKKALMPKEKTPNKLAEKGVTKRLSQFKTPEKNPKNQMTKCLTPMERKGSNLCGSSRPAKKARNFCGCP